MSWIEHLFRNGMVRAHAVLRDRIRYSKTAQAVAGLAWLAKYLSCPGSPHGLAALAAAHRTFLPLGWSGLTRRKMSLVAPGREGAPNRWRDEKIGWSSYRIKTSGKMPAMSHGLVVKPPVSPNEKGVLVVWVEYNLAALVSSSSLPRILGEYRVVYSTSWSPPDFSLTWALSGENGGESYMIPSNPLDASWIEAIPQPVKVLPFYASHWIADTPDFSPIPMDRRSFDLCLVANWAPFKRHWLLFRALRRLPDELRICLIGQPEGNHTVETAKGVAKAFGVRQEITWRNRLPADEVRKVQADSRAALMLSKREGSCLAIAESLMADSPVGVMADAHIGSKDFINDSTGVLLNEGSLSEDIARLLIWAREGRFSARRWASEHIEASVSLGRMNEILRQDALGRGENWTRDIKPFCLRSAVPVFTSMDDAVEARSWHSAFESNHGIRFIGPAHTEHCRDEAGSSEFDRPFGETAFQDPRGDFSGSH